MVNGRRLAALATALALGATAAAAVSPEKAAMLLERARTLAGGGQVEKAVAELRRAVAIDRKCEAAWLELARLSGGEAARTLQLALGSCPRSGRLWWAFAQLHWAAGRYSDATRPLENTLRYGEGAPYAAEAAERLAAACLMRGHYRSARRLECARWRDAVDEMSRRRLSADAFRLYYEAVADPDDEALARLERAARLAPKSALVSAALGREALAARRYGAAAEAYGRACSLRPDALDLREAAATAHLLAGDPKGALAVLTDLPAAATQEIEWLGADAAAVADGSLAAEAVAARCAANGGLEALRACIARFPAYLTPRVQLAGALRAEGKSREATAVLEAAEGLAGPPAVDAGRHARLGDLALEDRAFAEAARRYQRAIELCPNAPRHHGALARALVERGDLGPARDALARQLELDPASHDLPDSPPERGGEGHSLEPRLEPGDVLRYRYSTDGGQPGRAPAGVDVRYVVEAVQPGGLVEATLEIVGPVGRQVEGGADFAGATLAVICSTTFGLVDVGRPPGGPPREFAELLWLVQFLHGRALPAPRRPGQRWREPAWAELGRLYGGEATFERVRRGKAYLTRTLDYGKPAGGEAAAYEVTAVRGEASTVFDLERRVVEQAQVRTQITLRAADGTEARLPSTRHRLDLLAVDRSLRRPGRRRVLGVPYVRQVGPKCAAAALAMVLGYFGREVDQEALFAELRGGSRGVYIHRIPPAARRRGFAAHPHIGSLATLHRQLAAGAPVILFLTPMGMGHAVVAVGYDDGRDEFILHDPAAAPLTRVSGARLERQWRESGHTCIAIAPEKSAAFARLPYPHADAVAAMLDGDRAFAAGRLADAERAYRRALGLFPGYAEAHLALVRNLIAQARLADARAECDRLIAGRPDHLAAKLAKADVLILERRYAEAIALARAVEARDPRDLAALNVLATAHLASGRRGEAIAILERAVRIAPAWTDVRLRLAALYAAEGRHARAAAQYRAAIDYEPRNAQAHYLLALALLDRGDRRQAHEHARRCLALRPDGPFAARAKALLAR